MTANPSSKSSPGRPSEITAVAPTLLGYIADGLSLSDAASLSGITYRTLRRWVARGEAEVERVQNSSRKVNVHKRERPYVDFLKQYTEAMASHRQSLIQTAKLAAIGGYQLTETRTTIITKGGTPFQEVEEKKTKEVGPDGALALRLLQYEEQMRSREADSGQNKKDDPKLDILSRIMEMEDDELEALLANLEAAL